MVLGDLVETPLTASTAGGTHPTGMHSCLPNNSPVCSFTVPGTLQIFLLLSRCCIAPLYETYFFYFPSDSLFIGFQCFML